MKRKTKKQLAKQFAREEAQRMERARKVSRAATHRREIALLDSIEDIDLRLHSTVIVESREDAIIAANKESSPQASVDLVYFVGGSVKRDMSGYGKPDSSRSAGAVTCRDHSGVDVWDSASFVVTRKGHGSTKEAGMAAIAGAMVKAAFAVSAQPPKEDSTNRRVVIFSDCQSALNRIEAYRYDSPCRSNLTHNDTARRIITSSKALWDLGARVEIRWNPAHAGIKGIAKARSKADEMARKGDAEFSDVFLAECPGDIEQKSDTVDVASPSPKQQAPVNPGAEKSKIWLKFDFVKECYVLRSA